MWTFTNVCSVIVHVSIGTVTHELFKNRLRLTISYLFSLLEIRFKCSKTLHEG